jgi:hypothetical protein
MDGDPARRTAIRLLCRAGVAADGLAHGRPWVPAADGAARPYDCIAYRVAGIRAMEGRVAASHDPAQLGTGIEAIAGTLGAHWLRWLDPPIFLLTLVVLAMLPYAGRLGDLADLHGERLRLDHPIDRATARRGAAGLRGAGDGASLLQGQNGALSAALMGGGGHC